MIIRVTPRGMLNTFFRHRYMFASFFLLIFGLAATYCLIRPPRYESDAALLVKFAPSPIRIETTGLPSTGIAAAQLERKQIINSQIGVMQSQDLLVDCAQHRDDRHNLSLARGDSRSRSQRDAAPGSLQSGSRHSARRRTPISSPWRCSIRCGDRRQSLNVLIDKFIAKQSKIYQSAQLPFMQDQLAQARQKLEKSRAAVQAFKAATGINSLDEERTLLLRQQSDAQENLTQAMSKQQEAQGRYQKTRGTAEDHAQPISSCRMRTTVSRRSTTLASALDDLARAAEARSATTIAPTARR